MENKSDGCSKYGFRLEREHVLLLQGKTKQINLKKQVFLFFLLKKFNTNFKYAFRYITA